MYTKGEAAIRKLILRLEKEFPKENLRFIGDKNGDIDAIG